MDIGWKIASGISLAVAGILADKMVDLGWKAVTGRVPPRNTEEEAQANILELALFAIISGLFVTLFRRVTTKKVNAWYGGNRKDVLAEAETA